MVVLEFLLCPSLDILHLLRDGSFHLETLQGNLRSRTKPEPRRTVDVALNNRD